MITIKFEKPKGSYRAVKTEIVDCPVILQRDDVCYSAMYNGEVWRICSDDFCFNGWWSSEEAAKNIIKQLESSYLQ